MAKQLADKAIKEKAGASDKGAAHKEGKKAKK
jgi:hypothetical protein